MRHMKRSALLLLAAAFFGTGAARLSERTGEPTIVYIVRHAEKKSGEQLSDQERKDDRLVDLLPGGYVRAGEAGGCCPKTAGGGMWEWWLLCGGWLGGGRGSYFTERFSRLDNALANCPSAEGAG